MPNKDGSGPEGQGPLTGRGQGPCNDQTNNDTKPRPRLGLGRRWFGRGKSRNASGN